MKDSFSVSTASGPHEYTRSSRFPLLCRLGLHRWPKLRIPAPPERLIVEWVECCRCAEVLWGRGDSPYKLFRHIG